jgi:iturin family lipopeptide synthetase C
MAKKIEKINVQDIFELSTVQKGMLFHYLNEATSNVYNVQLAFEITGVFDFDLFKKCFQDVQERNEVLRSVFSWEKVNAPLQIILKACPLDFFYQDVSEKKPEEVLESVEQSIIRDQQERFDLAGLPLRISCIKKPDASFLLLITHHHILYDGWSTGILLKELFSRYKQVNTKQPSRYNDKSSYKDILSGIKKNNAAVEANAYWANYLRGYELSALPSTGDELDNKEVSKLHVVTGISNLEKFSGIHKVTKTSVIYTAFGILLQKYSNVSDVVFGTTVSGRDTAVNGMDKAIGNFINTVPLRMQCLDQNQTALDCIKNTNRDLIDRTLFCGTSYYEIKQLLELKASDQLFNTVVVIENYPLDEKSINSNSDFKLKLKSVYENTGIPLIITVFFKEQLEIELIYQRGFMEDDRAKMLADHYQAIISALLNDPDQQLSTINILSEHEWQELIHDYNDTDVAYPKNETVLSLVEKHRLQHSRQVAFSCGSTEVTYAELGDKSDKIASYLRQQLGIQQGDLVGILLKRDEQLLPCIFGIMKAGAAYVPIDPEYPTERIQTIINDSGIKALFIKGELRIPLEITATKLDLNKLTDAINDQKMIELPKVKGSDLVYVIYTSGSTGKPKGVMIEHENLMNYSVWSASVYFDDQPAIVALNSSISFDLTLTAIFTPLIRGDQIIIYPDNDITTVIETVIADNKVDTIKITASHLKIIKDSEVVKKQILSGSRIKRFIVGGEELETSLATSVYNLFNRKVDVYNEYGPTEATIGCMIYKFDLKDTTPSVPIGIPMANTQIYLLDNNLKPVPKGVLGEMYIGGDAVARGYLFNEALTRQKFLPNPFIPGKRIYKTGDYAKMLENRNILFLGRIDDQVKIRGFRIELTEIENSLLSHPDIKQAAAVAKKKGGEKVLAAYYLAEKEIASTVLRAYLLERLPAYMIPSYFVFLNQLPLTSNGKLDKKNLPDPEIVLENNYEAPRTAKEKLLATHWGSVLGIANPGIEDNFFSVGGDSIKSIQISAKMRNEGYEVGVNDIFTFPTIRQLAAKIKPLHSMSDQGAVTGEVPYSPAQEWFFKNARTDLHHFNQSVLLHFQEGISLDTLKKIIEKLVQQHDALRMSFKLIDGKIVQYNKGLELQAEIQEFQFAQQKDAEALMSKKSNEIQASVNLETGPLMQIGLFHLKKGSRVLMVIHHLVVDAVSWRILLEDFETLHKQSLKNEVQVLPLKTDSFQLWTKQLQLYAKSKPFGRAIDYWERNTYFRTDRILRDFLTGKNFFADQECCSFQLSKEMTEQLTTNAHAAFNTQMNELLLTGFLLAINKQYGYANMLIDLEGHGREEIGQEINVSRTIGWFTSIYPVLLEMQIGNLSAVLIHIKETLRKIPNKGMDYLLKQAIDAAYPSSEMAAGIDSQISFNYLGQVSSGAVDDSFSILSENKGEEISAAMEQKYDWNILGEIKDGQLELQLIFSNQQYKPQTVNAFMNAYKERLEEIITYCCSYKKTTITPSDLTYKELSVPAVRILQNKYDIEDVYTLSPMQEGMLFHSLLDAGSESYFEQKTLCLKGSLDLLNLEKSVNLLIERYSVLRSIYLHIGYKRPVQVVLKERKVNFRYRDVRKEWRENEQDKLLSFYQMTDRKETFDLSKDMLMRITVLQTADDTFEVIWSHHHILMDGWSSNIIWNELKVIYAGNLKGEKIALPPVKKYAEYIAWLEKTDHQQATEYWRNYLNAYDTVVSLPKNENKSLNKLSFKLASEQCILSETQTNGLQDISREYGVTLNTILQTVWGILLNKYNNVTDAVFGAVVSGRPAIIDDIDRMVGLFINTIPVRVRYDEDEQLGSALQRVQKNAMDSETYQTHSLSAIHASTSLGRELFDHVLVFENYPVSGNIVEEKPKADANEGFRVSSVAIFAQMNYDASLVIVPGDKIEMRLDYNALRYRKTQIENVLTYFNNIVNQIIQNNKLSISQIELLGAAEKQQLLDELDHSQVRFPLEKTLVGLFKEQVKRNPLNTAIKFEQQTVTYAELDQRSDKLAFLLREQDVKRNDVVGLLMDRDIDTVVGMLAILKAGGAYLPIDADYPDERISYLINDSGTHIILSSRRLKTTVEIAVPVLFIEDADLTTGEYSGTEINIHPSDLCYIIYTSGTTGHPKGVMVEHRNVVRLLFNDKFQFAFGPTDVWTMFHSHCFDFSVWEIYGAILFGGKLIIVPRMKAIDTSSFLKMLKEEKVTVLNQTPSAFYNLISSELQQPDSALHLRYIIFGGEALAPKKLKEWWNKYPAIKLINMFGITETTVHVTYKEIGAYEIDNNISNIGKPIPTLSVYVLDKQQRMVPKEAIGELYVGGAGVSRGYLGKKELTDSKFIVNPYNAQERIYRSGDLAKIMENGDIEYIGRMDSQIQLRGFRIELGEMEHQLSTHPDIKEAAVVAFKKNGEPYLTAYYVSEKEIPVIELKKFLYNKLPEYMVPSFYVHQRKFPLTDNGKLDKRALQEPEIKSVELTARPKNELQKELVNIWAEVLDIEKNKIGIHTNFFDVGGNSLKLVRMVDMMNTAFHKNITVAQAFTYPVIEMLAEFLSGTQQQEQVESGFDQVTETMSILDRMGE